MITKITRLKKFGIFYDFTWKEEIPDFKKFNLIYGWNRSGKTTLSRVFASCEKKSLCDKDKFKQYPENGEFEIKTSDGQTVKNTDVATNILPIKVFNQDFIDDNISFDPSDSCNPIVYVSEEDIESKRRLEILTQHKITLAQTYEDARKDKLAIEKNKNDFLTSLGREISNILFDKAYNRTKVENKVTTIGIDNFSDKMLADGDRKKYEVLSKSEAGKNQQLFSDYIFSFLFEGEIINGFSKIFITTEKLLGKKVISETLERLKNDLNLNNWVKQGLDLHKSKNEKTKCLFCQEPLAEDFLLSLSKHFSKDYEELQNLIVHLKNEILKIKKTPIEVKNDELYPDLKNSYTSKAKELNDCIEKTNIWIDLLIKKLEEKYNNPLAPVTTPEMPQDFLALYKKCVAEINEILSSHNEKVKNHNSEVVGAREKLENHTIAVALLQQDYKKMLNDLTDAVKNEKNAEEEFSKNNSEISELIKKTSNIGKAIKDINKHLKEFFGREEITLELDDSKKGYTIKRSGHPAKNLSEGEKTAIAFSYFIVKVGEGDFDKTKGIVFIDDPISSFDSNFIYHCFSMINIHFKEIGQLFISTHNFQFFNLAKEWFIKKNKSTKRDNEKPKTEDISEKPIPCEFFMVENFTESDIRKAKIVALDKTLQNYKSEYHFLFAKLKEFSEKDTRYEDFYTIGNIARRFFDIFADFKIPTTGDQKSKMDVLLKIINEQEEKISATDSNKAYKLVNEFSHNSDPTSTIEHKDKNESQTAIKILLNIIKNADPKHFEILAENTL